MSVVTRSAIFALLIAALVGCGGETGSSLNTSTVEGRPDGELTSFVAGPALPVALHSSVSVRIGNKVYLIGGHTPTVATKAIYEATITTDGTLNFALSPFELDIPRMNASLVKIKNYIYVIGGRDTISTFDSIARAPCDKDGLTGNFVTISEKLTDSRAYAAAVVTGNYIHIIGGRVNGSESSTVERAAFDTNGALTGDFQLISEQLVERRRTHAAAVLGQNLYVIGGEDGVSLKSIERCTINSDGTISAFAAAPVDLSEERNRLVVAVLNGKLYVMGGVGLSGFLTSVDEADITNNELGSFQQSSLSLPYEVEDTVGLLLNTHFYLIGGRRGTVRDTVLKAEIQK